MSHATQHDATSAQEKRLRSLAWVGLALALVVLVLFRLHAFGLPLETDECNYAYFGAHLLDGDRLYVDLWDHQPPGVFVLFAGIIAIFGDEPIVFRLMAMAFSVVSLLLMFSMLRRWYGPMIAVAGALLFAVVSSDPGTAGEGCNREIYMNTFVLGAWWLASSRDRVSRRGLFGAGLLLGVGSTIKTVLAVHWVVLAGMLLVGWFCRGTADDDGSPSRANGGRRAKIGWLALLGWFSLGPLLVWISVAGYFALSGRWDAFTDAVFLFNVSYAEGTAGFFARFITFFDPPKHPHTFDSAIGLWIGAGVSVVVLIVGLFRVLEAGLDETSDDLDTGRPRRLKPAARGSWAILSFAGASFLAVCLPAHFWPHYYYLLIPPMVMLCAAAVASVVKLLGGTPFRAWVPLAAFAVLLAHTSHTQYRDYLRQSPLGITMNRYKTRDFWGRAQGENVRRVTDPADTVFVCGNDASIYYYARRRCASRFTMITGVTSNDPRVSRRRDTLRAELERDPPRVIIVSEPGIPFDGWRAFLAEHYGPAVGEDLHDINRGPIMFVFARKDKPIEPINWDWDRSELSRGGDGLP